MDRRLWRHVNGPRLIAWSISWGRYWARARAGSAMAALRHVWTAPHWQGDFYVLPFGRCGHVCGLFVRHTEAAGHNAFR
jgi:hypothetical protein